VSNAGIPSNLEAILFGSTTFKSLRSKSAVALVPVIPNHFVPSAVVP